MASNRDTFWCAIPVRLFLCNRGRMVYFFILSSRKPSSIMVDCIKLSRVPLSRYLYSGLAFAESRSSAYFEGIVCNACCTSLFCTFCCFFLSNPSLLFFAMALSPSPSPIRTSCLCRRHLQRRTILWPCYCRQDF
jgi:hypothetical protein